MSATTAVPSFDLDTVPEEYRARVEAMIPPPGVADAYVHRNVKGVWDFDMLDTAVARKRNVLLAGDTGSSKTTLFRAYAAARGLPFALVECNAAMDPGVVLGRTTLYEGGVEFVPGDFTLVVMFGGVGLVDEVNLAHPRITAGFHALLSVIRALSLPESGMPPIRAGRSGTGEPQPTLFGAAYNPGRQYAGTVNLNDAFKNRFAYQLDWGYDRGVEEALVTGVDGKPADELLEVGEHIRSLAEIRTPVSTNSLMEFVENADDFGLEFAIGTFVDRFPSEERVPVSRALEAKAEVLATEMFGARADAVG